MTKRIQIGDYVYVTFPDGNFIYGTVLAIPQDVGDQWVIEETGGVLHHIILFCQMTQINKKATVA